MIYQSDDMKPVSHNGGIGKVLLRYPAVSLGKGVKYPYYRCITPKCLGSIKKDDLESEFAKILVQAHPRKGLIQILEAVVQCEVEERHRQAAQRDSFLKEQARSMEKEKKAGSTCHRRIKPKHSSGL